MADARDIDYIGSLNATNVEDALEELAKRSPEPPRELIEQLVQEAVAALPPPEDGLDADYALIEQMVQDAVDALPEVHDGEDADPELIAALVREAVAELPPPLPGAPGTPGANADPALIGKMIGDAVAALPAPPPAEPGAPGAPGQPGAPGVGVPPGGETGWVLAKASQKSYDTEWIMLPKQPRFAIWNQQGPAGAAGASGNPTTTFGVGAPLVINGVEAALYFDTSPGTSYNGYVFHNGAWYPFAAGGATPPTYVPTYHILGF